MKKYTPIIKQFVYLTHTVNRNWNVLYNYIVCTVLPTINEHQRTCEHVEHRAISIIVPYAVGHTSEHVVGQISKLDNLTQKRRALHDGSVDRRLHREQDSIFDKS